MCNRQQFYRVEAPMLTAGNIYHHYPTRIYIIVVGIYIWLEVGRTATTTKDFLNLMFLFFPPSVHVSHSQSDSDVPRLHCPPTKGKKLNRD